MEGKQNLRDAETAYESMRGNTRTFPHLEKVDEELGALAKQRLKLQPNVQRAYGGWGPWFKALYAEVMLDHPELQKSGNAAASAAAAAGGGGGSRPARPGNRGGAPKPPQNRKRGASDTVRRSLGFRGNPYQEIPSKKDLENEAEARGLAALDQALGRLQQEGQ
jgi:hypothetical protein